MRDHAPASPKRRNTLVASTWLVFSPCEICSAPGARRARLADAAHHVHAQLRRDGAVEDGRPAVSTSSRVRSSAPPGGCSSAPRRTTRLHGREVARRERLVERALALRRAGEHFLLPLSRPASPIFTSSRRICRHGARPTIRRNARAVNRSCPQAFCAPSRFVTKKERPMRSKLITVLVLAPPRARRPWATVVVTNTATPPAAQLPLPRAGARGALRALCRGAAPRSTTRRIRPAGVCPL